MDNLSSSSAETSTVLKWMRAVADAAIAFEGRWTFRALNRVNPGLHQLMTEQLDLFHAAQVTGTAAEVETQGAATVRGYQAIAKAMATAGESDDAYVIGQDLRTGLVIAIGDRRAATARVRDVHGNKAIFVTPDEVAGLLASIEGLARLKQIFPGAEILGKPAVALTGIDRHPGEPDKGDAHGLEADAAAHGLQAMEDAG